MCDMGIFKLCFTPFCCFPVIQKPKPRNGQAYGYISFYFSKHRNIFWFLYFYVCDDSVPRSLLPGVRSSRLRDRQKEEREFLVKKAFVEDIEKESDLVTVLLQKSFSDYAMLWDVDMLPSSGKESELHKNVSADASKGNDQSDNNDSQDVLDQMSLNMENYSDFYVDDDVSCEFEIDTGTLPCIACGILGFPFMALVQPSEKSAKHLFPEEFQNKEESGVLKHVESDNHRCMFEDYNRGRRPFITFLPC